MTDFDTLLAEAQACRAELERIAPEDCSVRIHLVRDRWAFEGVLWAVDAGRAGSVARADEGLPNKLVPLWRHLAGSAGRAGEGNAGDWVEDVSAASPWERRHLCALCKTRPAVTSCNMGIRGFLYVCMKCRRAMQMQDLLTQARNR